MSFNHKVVDVFNLIALEILINFVRLHIGDTAVDSSAYIIIHSFLWVVSCIIQDFLKKVILATNLYKYFSREAVWRHTIIEHLLKKILVSERRGEAGL